MKQDESTENEDVEPRLDAKESATPYRQDGRDAAESDLYAEHRDRLRLRLTELEDFERERAELLEELVAVESRINRRNMAVLDEVRVASPCPEAWDSMAGDDRNRHCLMCDKTVYNLSSMSRLEAAAFVEGARDSDVCVTYFRRADGKVMTSDCDAGLVRLRKRRRRAEWIGAAAVSAAALPAAAVQIWMEEPEPVRASAVIVEDTPASLGATPNWDRDRKANPGWTASAKKVTHFGQGEIKNGQTYSIVLNQTIGRIAARHTGLGFQLAIPAELSASFGDSIAEALGKVTSVSVRPFSGAPTSRRGHFKTEIDVTLSPEQPGYRVEVFERRVEITVEGPPVNRTHFADRPHINRIMGRLGRRNRR